MFVTAEQLDFMVWAHSNGRMSIHWHMEEPPRRFTDERDELDSSMTFDEA